MEFWIGFVLASLRVNLLMLLPVALALTLAASSIPAAAWLPVIAFIVLVLLLWTTFAFLKFRRFQKQNGDPAGWGLLSERERGQAAAQIGFGF